MDVEGGDFFQVMEDKAVPPDGHGEGEGAVGQEEVGLEEGTAGRESVELQNAHDLHIVAFLKVGRAWEEKISGGKGGET